MNFQQWGLGVYVKGCPLCFSLGFYSSLQPGDGLVAVPLHVPGPYLDARMLTLGSAHHILFRSPGKCLLSKLLSTLHQWKPGLRGEIFLEPKQLTHRGPSCQCLGGGQLQWRELMLETDSLCVPSDKKMRHHPSPLNQP